MAFLLRRSLKFIRFFRIAVIYGDLESRVRLVFIRIIQLLYVREEKWGNEPVCESGRANFGGNIRLTLGNGQEM